MKGYLLTALALALCLTTAPAKADAPEIGVCVYNAADTFMTSIISEIEAGAEDVAELHVLDSGNDQNVQNDQVVAFLEQGVDALIINAVDRTAAVYLIRLAQNAGTPIVFINREPLREDMASYDGAYYVGTDARETGRLCGELVVDYFTRYPYADKNNDDAIQYVLLKGEPGHQDAEYRTIYSILAIQDAGYSVERLAGESAMWERALGREKMASFLTAYGERIECVISNNDDMALGAIDALKAAGYFTRGRVMPVVGVDSTEPALEALTQGSLWGTVLNDAVNQGRAALKLAVLLAGGGVPSADNYPYAMDSHYVYIPSRKITKENVASGIPVAVPD